MQHRYGPEALDQTLSDLFRINGQDISLWRHVEVLHLTKNMHLDNAPESNVFAQQLLKVGAGSHLPPDKSILLPPNTCLPQNNIEALINAIYPGLDQGNISNQFIPECTILSSKNNTIDQLNQIILDRYVSPDINSVHWLYYIFLDSLERSLSIRVWTRLIATTLTYTLLSPSTPSMPLDFLWHVSFSKQDALSCCFSILIQAMVFVMAHAWCCWRLEQWLSGVLYWVVIIQSRLSLFQG